MRKKALFLLFLMLFNYFYPLYEVFAEVNFSFTNNTTYHVVWVKSSSSISGSCSNGGVLNIDSSSIENIADYNDYNAAVDHMNRLSSTEDKVASIVGLKTNANGTKTLKILNSKYAIADLNTTGTSIVTSYIYTSSTSSNVYTYMNGYGSFGGVDAAFLDYSPSNERAKVKISGVSGWITNTVTDKYGQSYVNYDVVPISLLKSTNYYYVNSDNELVHVLSRKVTADSCYSTSYPLGPAPSFLSQKDNNGNVIKYYSFDSNYFYTSLITMLDDYKNNSNNAVNKNSPYYNYYMYSPIRNKSNYTPSILDDYLKNISDYTSSALYNQGQSFFDAQNSYGSNALLMYATAIHESAWGKSALALTKNNIFGHSAYDSDFYDSATGYVTVRDGILAHAYRYMNLMFVETKDYSGRYFGSHLGNKNSGINVKYASDPYWGEKIASQYYKIDRYGGMKDYYSKMIGIKETSDNVLVKKDANTSSTTLYELKNRTYNVSLMPTIILDRVVGEVVNGSNIWYKVQTDALLDKERTTVLQDPTYETYYDWDNNYAYIHSSQIRTMGEDMSEHYQRVDGLFRFESMNYIAAENKFDLKGFLVVKGVNNTNDKSATYDVMFVNQDNASTYTIPLQRWTNNVPFTIPGENGLDYSGAWFDGKIDLSGLPQGNYNIYVRARTQGKEAVSILSNVLVKPLEKKITDNNGRGYQFRVNYYLKTVPVELFIRDNGLITEEEVPTEDNIFNQYTDISFSNNNLNVKGTSFNIKGNYSTSTNVERWIVLENTETFERFEYSIGYTDSGDYKVTLRQSDGYDKTRAWFNSNIDISSLSKGKYAIYIRTKSNIDDYGELNDIFMKELNKTATINGKVYTLQLNQNQRFRLELVVS